MEVFLFSPKEFVGFDLFFFCSLQEVTGLLRYYVMYIILPYAFFNVTSRLQVHVQGHGTWISRA